MDYKWEHRREGFHSPVVSSALQFSQITKEVLCNDIQLLIDNGEAGLALLRLVEIIGQDEIETIGPETLYFIISTLNQLDIDPLRNKILLKVLPLKVKKYK